MNVLVGLICAGSVLSAAAAENPKWPGQYGELKVLNNFVTELLSAPSLPADPFESAFLNPRKGWVFVALSKGAGAAPACSFDGSGQALVWRVNPQDGALESMQWLDDGAHRLVVRQAKGRRLIVRAVPELMYCYYPTKPHIAVQGPYEWRYTERYILSHVNVIVTRSEVSSGEFEQWLHEGRQWLNNVSLLGLGKPEPPAVGAVASTWESAAKPGFAGIIVDEFGGSPRKHYGAWNDALKRLHETAAFKGKTFYAWCGDLFKDSPEFSRTVLGLGDRFCWEVYLHEQPTRAKAAKLIDDDLVAPMAEWKAALPGIEKQLVLALGYLSAPPETLNVNPAVDYQAFLDMQFETLATNPAFFGLYGIMEYMADYADEESLRFAHLLMRHYCIEGKRTPFTKDPYELTHVENPDFAHGLAGWRVEAAEPAAVDAKAMPRFSWLEGRYPEVPQGSRFCWMKRSAHAPNRISQTIQNLEPGRLYSLKFYSADLRNLDAERETTVSVAVSGAELLGKYGFQFLYPSSYSHTVGPYNRDHPAYITWHRLVFRAAGATADLAISDWRTPQERGGPIGQETIVNFIEVQPFWEP